MRRATASIIIPLYNQIAFTKLCIDYLFRNTPIGIMDLILVDNASSDGTGEFLDRIPSRVRKIVNRENLGFAKACNQGAAVAETDYLVFLNNDTVPHKGWLEALIGPAEKDSSIGMVGSKLIFPDGCIQQSGVVFASSGIPYHLYSGCDGGLPGANKARYFSALTGACMLMPRKTFQSAGGFDERYVNGMEDIALCRKISSYGLKILYNPESVVTHFESRTEGRQRNMDANVELYLREWRHRSEQDDYRYLREDGMELWVEDGRISFIPETEAAVRSLPFLARAREHAAKGAVHEAFQVFEKLLGHAPCRSRNYLAMHDLAKAQGLEEPARKLMAMVERYR